jgi:hypothetical protein
MNKLIFLHLPRCGGTVISAILNGHWGPNNYMWFGTWGNHVREWLDAHPNWRGIGGHFWLHNYEEYISEPYIHITTLRNPVERVLSHYYYIQVQKDHPLSEEANQMSIEEIYKNGLGWHMQMNDLMTAFLCNNETIDLELAKENLRTQFHLFGLQERLQEFAAILRATLMISESHKLDNWPNLSREPLSNIPREVIKLVEENNALDIELYDYAKELYFSTIYRVEDTGDELT